MGKPTGFLEWQRVVPEKLAPSHRLRDFKEMYRPQAVEQMRQQSGRCMDCGVPMCQQGCPLGNQIPDWNDMVYRDRWRDAHVRLATTNNFPEFTGRLCPAPCEGACVLSINQPAVTIEQTEKEIIERAFAEGWATANPPRQRTGQHVAVVGSGPAGLAAAAQLNSVGHRVTVFERSDRIGGLLRYGIPDFKLEKHIIDRRIELMKDEGIQFVTNSDVGGSVSWGELRQRHDALIIATGAGHARDLQVPGRELAGVHFAMDFLTQQNRRNAGDAIDDPAIDAAGKHVVILGGGDTGSDCLGTALRQGARSVHQVELMPRPPGERAVSNPWPQWPMVFRTSTSQEEGGERDFALMTEILVGDETGALKTVRANRVELRAGADGRSTFEPVAGGAIELPCDLLLLAMGFLGPDTASLVDQLGVELTARGNVAVDANFATNIDGVFSAGDAQRGQSLIVWAISDGRETARGVDAYLRAGEEAQDARAPTVLSALPSRGTDYPFGGR